MPEWKHKARYADVQALRRDGWWPDKKVPAWAQERADHYQTAPTAVAVLESAYVEEIERLQNVVNQLEPACEFMETSLRSISEFCTQEPDTAQFADSVIGRLAEFGDLFREPPITIRLSNKISDHNACFQDIFNTLKQFVDERTMDEMSWRRGDSSKTLISVSPLLKDHVKIDDCIRLVVSCWEEKEDSYHAHTF